MKRVTSCLIVVVLFGAILVQILGNRINANDKRINLLRLRNFECRGWIRSEVPLGNTPEMLQAVERILGYDEVVSWRFESGGREIQLYAAYWAPGRISSKEVAMHTPDNCWVTAGWAPIRKGEVGFASGGRSMKPAQDRIFSINGTTVNVVFWHVYGDHVISYNKIRPSFWDGIKDVIRDGLRLRKEQLFLRISSNNKIEDVQNWDVFRELVHVLDDTVPALRSGSSIQ